MMEKIMAGRIAKAALRCKALDTSQFGAIENRSAIDALSAILHPSSLWLMQPKKTRHRKPRPTLLANNIQGAFNNTDPHRLVKIMETRQLPSYLVTWNTTALPIWTATRVTSISSPLPHIRPGHA
jgi:hypothetical protein